jgi:hypothetical protein
MRPVFISSLDLISVIKYIAQKTDHMRRILLFIIFILISCEDSYELIVSPELDQKMHFNFNGTITFPTSAFTKDFDPSKDRFELIKIKFVPIKKWHVDAAFQNDSKYSEWGQAGIHVQIKRTNSLFMSDEIIYENFVEHFFNPTTNSNPTVEIYNEDGGDSGLNSIGFILNSDKYADNINNILVLQLPFSNREKHFNHTLTKKSASELDGSENLLFSTSLEKSTIMFPFDSLRYKELSEISF